MEIWNQALQRATAQQHGFVCTPPIQVAFRGTDG